MGDLVDTVEEQQEDRLDTGGLGERGLEMGAGGEECSYFGSRGSNLGRLRDGQ